MASKKKEGVEMPPVIMISSSGFSRGDGGTKRSKNIPRIKSPSQSLSDLAMFCLKLLIIDKKISKKNLARLGEVHEETLHGFSQGNLVSHEFTLSLLYYYAEGVKDFPKCNPIRARCYALAGIALARTRAHIKRMFLTHEPGAIDFRFLDTGDSEFTVPKPLFLEVDRTARAVPGASVVNAGSGAVKQTTSGRKANASSRNLLGRLSNMHRVSSSSYVMKNPNSRPMKKLEAKNISLGDFIEESQLVENFRAMNYTKYTKTDDLASHITNMGRIAFACKRLSEQYLAEANLFYNHAFQIKGGDISTGTAPLAKPQGSARFDVLANENIDKSVGSLLFELIEKHKYQSIPPGHLQLRKSTAGVDEILNLTDLKDFIAETDEALRNQWMTAITQSDGIIPLSPEKKWEKKELDQVLYYDILRPHLDNSEVTGLTFSWIEGSIPMPEHIEKLVSDIADPPEANGTPEALIRLNKLERGLSMINN